jgi:hypothetical protein
MATASGGIPPGEARRPALQSTLVISLGPFNGWMNFLSGGMSRCPLSKQRVVKESALATSERVIANLAFS